MSSYFRCKYTQILHINRNNSLECTPWCKTSILHFSFRCSSGIEGNNHGRFCSNHNRCWLVEWNNMHFHGNNYSCWNSYSLCFHCKCCMWFDNLRKYYVSSQDSQSPLRETDCSDSFLDRFLGNLSRFEWKKSMRNSSK